jgi:pimeloyl-ACP methyl ester carboxylesterase
LAIRRAVVREPRGQGRALLAVAGFQLPRWPEHVLRVGDGVERAMRGWAGAEWSATAGFGDAVARYRAAARIPGAAYCAMEYYRWAVRSQLRAEGRRFAAAVARPAEAPVLSLHGADDPWLLARTGTGHFPHEERPAPVTARIADFLDG